MDIIIKNADFSSVAVTKIGEGYNVSNKGNYIDQTGALQLSNGWAISEAIPLTPNMREKGIIVNNCRASTSIPAVVFLNSSTISTSNAVGYFLNDGEGHDALIPSDAIPQTATHVVANGYGNKTSILYDNYLLNVLDIEESQGYISATGAIISSDPSYVRSQMIPVENDIEYHLRAVHISTYNSNGDFIERLAPSQVADGIVNNKTFSSPVAYIILDIQSTKHPLAMF